MRDVFFTVSYEIKDEEDFLKKCYNKLDESSQETFLEILFEVDGLNDETINKMARVIGALKNEVAKFSFSIRQPKQGFSKNDLQCLINLSDILKEDIRVLEKRGMVVSLFKTVGAYANMGMWLRTMDLMELSPFEKVLFVHDVIANNVYNFSEGNPMLLRDEVREFVDSGLDGVVKVGAARIMEALCERLNIDNRYISGVDRSMIGQRFNGCCANLIYIKDEKYDIDGWYFCDVRRDCKVILGEANKYYYAAVPVQDIKRIPQAKYLWEEFLKMDLPSFSEAISINSFKEALIGMYGDKKMVEKAIDGACDWEPSWCDRSCDNSFAKEYNRRKASGR